MEGSEKSDGGIRVGGSRIRWRGPAYRWQGSDFKFNLYDGQFKHHSVLLDATNNREEALLLEIQQGIIRGNGGESQCDGIRKPFVQGREKRDRAEFAVVVCGPLFVQWDSAGSFPGG